MIKKKFSLILILFMVFVSGVDAQFSKKIVSLTGKIIDEYSRKPVGIKMLVYDENGKKVSRANSNSSTGYYYITGLKPGKSYYMKFKDDAYFKESIPFDLPETDKYAEFSKDFLVKPLQIGLKLLIKIPPFELNKSKLRVGRDFILENITRALKENRTIKFEIVCFPDNDEEQEFNAKLTTGRANALKAYFEEQGIRKERITKRGRKLTDANLPPPSRKRAKGKRYIGSSYIVVRGFTM